MPKPCWETEIISVIRDFTYLVDKHTSQICQKAAHFAAISGLRVYAVDRYEQFSLTWPRALLILLKNLKILSEVGFEPTPTFVDQNTQF